MEAKQAMSPKQESGPEQKPDPIGENAGHKKGEATKPIGARTPPKKKWGSGKFLEEVMRRGPRGAPVYDNMGFELDYKKVAPSFRPRARPSHKKVMAMMEKNRQEEKRKCEIMGTMPDQVSGITLMAWNDRVSRDLSVPYHKVEIKHFEEWQVRGFTAEPGEFEAKNMSAEEKDRISELATGSAFRK